MPKAKKVKPKIKKPIAGKVPANKKTKGSY